MSSFVENFIVLQSNMQLTKFQGKQLNGSGEDHLLGFYHLWTWQPCWSCDLDCLNKLSSPQSLELYKKLAYNWPSGFFFFFWRGGGGGGMFATVEI